MFKLKHTQEALQKHFQSIILPLLKYFENIAKVDEVFIWKATSLATYCHMCMVTSLCALMISLLNALQGRWCSREFSHPSKVSTNIFLKEQLCEVALLDEFDRECFQRSPGANEIEGHIGVSLGRDEAHERVISRDLAFHHPQHPTQANVEVMCKSAPILTQNQYNLLKTFFPSKTFF